MSEPDRPAPSPAPDWRHGTAFACAELAFAALLIAGYLRHFLVHFSATPYLCALGWISLRLRGLRWKDVGLRWYRSWAMTLATGAAVGVGMEILELFGTQPLLVRLTGVWPDLSQFKSLTGNVKFLAAAVPLIWILAALGEEAAYRGYLMNRVASAFRAPRAGWAVSLIVVSTAFGLTHLYQGRTGVIENVLAGLQLGLIYLAFGRNLSVLIVAHGVQDTIDVLLIFFGVYPGMS